MRDFRFSDHAGDMLRARPFGDDGDCDCPEPSTSVRIDARSVHLPIPQQRALAQWLIDHLAEVRPGEDLSLVLPNPQAAPVELDVAPAERPDGYLLTLAIGRAELSVSDSHSLPSMEMQMLIDAAGRAMARFGAEAVSEERGLDLEALERALYPDRDPLADPLDAGELISGVSDLRIMLGQARDHEAKVHATLLERHQQMAEHLGMTVGASFIQLLERAKQARKAQIDLAMHLTQVRLLTEALERVRAEFFDIDEEPFEGHVSADVSRAIVDKIDKALSAARE